MKLFALLICLVMVCASSINDAQLQDEDTFDSPLGRLNSGTAHEHPSPPSILSEEPKLHRYFLPADVALSSTPSVNVVITS
jgi:hypothetical protein